MSNGICCDTCTGELTINSVSMHTPAWCCLDLTPLWLPAASRGNNVILPGAAGTRAYRRRRDETTVALRMVISGAVDQSDTPYSDPIEGLRQNLDYLNTNVLAPPTAATYAASLDSPDGGTTLTADVQVIELELSENIAHVMNAVLHLRIPAGRFA